jgi:hypothetical protein
MVSRQIATMSMAACAAMILQLAAAHSSPALAQQGDHVSPAKPSQAEETSPPANTARLQDNGLPVLLVTSLTVTHPEGKPAIDLIRVTGLASSGGWIEPRLVPTYEGPAPDGVLDLELIATPPEHTLQADGFQAMDALLELPAGHPYTAIRVRGAENALAIDHLPGATQAEIKVDDCHDCVGKHFEATTTSGTANANAITSAGLPRVLRVIRPSDGVYGADLDPNRLTLLLDGKGTIVKAFWE